MSKHWSCPLDDYTQDYNVLEVPAEFLRELKTDAIASIQRIYEGGSEELRIAAKFLNNIDRVMLSLVDAHVTVSLNQQEDGTPEKCSSTLDICNLLRREMSRRPQDSRTSVTLIIKEWLEIGIGSEFQVFVLNSTIKGTLSGVDRSTTQLHFTVLSQLFPTTAIFQRKAERDKMTIEQRKEHLFILKDFLRSIVLDIQQEDMCKLCSTLPICYCRSTLSDLGGYAVYLYAHVNAWVGSLHYSCVCSTSLRLAHHL
jgi:hypothetical protein